MGYIETQMLGDILVSCLLLTIYAISQRIGIVGGLMNACVAVMVGILISILIFILTFIYYLIGNIYVTLMVVVVVSLMILKDARKYIDKMRRIFYNQELI